jgi:translation elongation factor EF-G
MKIEDLRIELGTIISGLTSSGFNNTDPKILEKIDELTVTTGESGMKEVKRLLENLSGAIKAIQEGKSQAESGTVRLTALDFYLKNLPDSDNIEDL